MNQYLHPMDWKNAQIDALPNDGDQVLIAVNGIYYFAKYNKKANSFSVKKDNDIRYFAATSAAVYWTQMNS